MWKIVQDSIIFLIAFFINANALRISQISNPVELSNLLSDNHNEPLVIRLDTGKPQTSTEDDLPTDKVEGLVEDVEQPDANEDAAYILYHLLRTKKQDDDSDPVLDGTKQVLRQALRARCQKVDKCVKKCPPVQSYCPLNCKQVFDNLDLCPPPKPKKKKKDCSKPKCGKTMPPKWKFKF